MSLLGIACGIYIFKNTAPVVCSAVDSMALTEDECNAIGSGVCSACSFVYKGVKKICLAPFEIAKYCKKSFETKEYRIYFTPEETEALNAAYKAIPNNDTLEQIKNEIKLKYRPAYNTSLGDNAWRIYVNMLEDAETQHYVTRKQKYKEFYHLKNKLYNNHKAELIKKHADRSAFDKFMDGLITIQEGTNVYY